MRDWNPISILVLGQKKVLGFLVPVFMFLRIGYALTYTRKGALFA